MLKKERKKTDRLKQSSSSGKVTLPLALLGSPSLLSCAKTDRLLRLLQGGGAPRILEPRMHTASRSAKPFHRWGGVQIFSHQSVPLGGAQCVTCTIGQKPSPLPRAKRPTLRSLDQDRNRCGSQHRGLSVSAGGPFQEPPQIPKSTDTGTTGGVAMWHHNYSPGGRARTHGGCTRLRASSEHLLEATRS